MSEETNNDNLNQQENNNSEQQVNDESNQLEHQNEVNNCQDQTNEVNNENDGNQENDGDGEVEQQSNQEGNGEGEGEDRNDGNGNDGEYSQDDGGENRNSLNDSNNQQKQPSKTITEPEQFRKVFIGGLSYKTDDETLKNYFAKYGELVDYVVMKDSQSGRSRGFGFVTYSDSFMVDELMKNRPHVIDGRQVEPKRATPREDSGKAEVQMTVKKLFIGGLKDNITEEDLKAYFGQYGSIEEAVVMREKETSKSRGFGFVTFDDYDPVDKVILEKHHTINGVNVHAQKALPKEFNDKNSNNNRVSGQMQNNFNRNDHMNYQINGNFNQNNNNNGFFNNNQHNFGGGQMRNNFKNGNMNGGGGGNYNNNNNGGLNNSFGNYNQASNQPRTNNNMGGGMNPNMMNNMNNNNNNQMNGNKMGGGGGPIRGGQGRFMNRSSGPYGQPNFNNNNMNNGNNFNQNNNRNRVSNRGGSQH